MREAAEFLLKAGSRLALVEGIPGSGKTTTARALQKAFAEMGVPADMYLEGDSHPADCAWQAVMSEPQYRAMRKRALSLCESEGEREALAGQLDALSRPEGERTLLAYTRLRFPRPDMACLYGEFAEYELCDGRRPLGEFARIHRERWARFAAEAAKKPGVTIFECAFLQNHIFELMGTYMLSDGAIVAHLRALADTVAALRPAVVYMLPENPEAVLSQAAAERRAPEGSGRKDWIDEISAWLSGSVYGKAKGLSGFSSVLAFCGERMRLDALALGELGLPVYTVKR